MIWVIIGYFVLAGIITVAAIFGSSGFQNKAWLPFSIWALLVSAASVAQLVFAHKITKRLGQKKYRQRIEKVYGNLEGAYHVAGLSQGDRMTLYVKHKKNEELLVQSTPYVPDKTFGPFKKGLHTSKGLVGWCFRKETRRGVVLKDKIDFREYMIDKWGFTREDTNLLDSHKKSYWAMAVLNKEKKVAGVLYCESERKDAFTEEVIKLLLRVCIPLAEFV